ncbi:hypothetical protein GS488_12650 [Rhodococcus hoagii]|nr:hypothetical protein [Prescottella equi]
MQRYTGYAGHAGHVDIDGTTLRVMSWNDVHSVTPLDQVSGARLVPPLLDRLGTLEIDASCAPGLAVVQFDQSQAPVFSAVHQWLLDVVAVNSKRYAPAPVPSPSFAVIDLETTGFAYKRTDRIVEIGVVQLDAHANVESR